MIFHKYRWHIISAKMQKKTPRECRKRWGEFFAMPITILSKHTQLEFGQRRFFQGKENGLSLLNNITHGDDYPLSYS